MSDSSKPDLVFYDGECGLCHALVRWLVARDRDGSAFRFAPLYGPTFLATVPVEARRTLPDSLVLRRPDGTILVKSAAVAAALGALGQPWRAVGGMIAVVPRALSDAAYDGIARMRRRLFGAPSGSCPVTPPELRARFLD